MATDPGAFFERWIKALNEFDFAAIEEMVDPDVILDLPQSGERIHGFQSWRTHIESYPGGLAPNSTEAVGASLFQEPERWAITPGYTVIRMSNPDHYTTTVKVAYPDGSRWWIVTLVETSGDRIHRLESYFAPVLPAPLAESIASWPHG